MTLRQRLVRSMAVLVGVSLLLAGVGSVVFLDAMLTRDLGTALHLEARTAAAEWLATGRLPERLPAGRVAAIYAPDGSLLASSGGDVPAYAPPLGLSRRGDELQYLMPLPPPSGAFLLVEASLASVEAPVRRLEEALLVVIVAALAIAVGLATRVADSVAGPIARLASEVSRISETGDLEATVEEKASGLAELEELTATFNRMLATLRDIFRALEASEQRERTLREMAAHDLRTPLATVLGSLELLARGQVEGPAAKEAAGLAYREAQRLAREVEGLLGRPGPGASDLAEVARRVARGHEVRVEGGALFAQVPTEEAVRTLQLLVDNAERHNPPGTRVWLEARRVGDTVRVTVADDGVGMDAETRARAFERFYSGDRRGGGLGLGLSLVKALVEARRGSVELESAPGHGTRVTVAWPAAPPPAPSS
jgi:signal transduction histidine kinase